MVTSVTPEQQSNSYIYYIRNFFNYINKNKSLSIGIFFLGIIVFMALFADYISPYHFAERNSNCTEEYTSSQGFCRYSPPSWTLDPTDFSHIMGTNLLGRDVFARVIYGSRLALQMSLTATVIAVGIGIPMGVLSGYFGGVVDRLLNSVSDAIYSFPSLLLAITLAIALLEYGDLGILMAVSVSTAVVYIPLYFKVARSQVLRIKTEAYVDAGKSMGASNTTIIMKYVIPNILAAPLALVPFNMTEAILTNAGLAFLGLGVQAPTADWGFDVFVSKGLTKVRARSWLIFFPGFFIFLLSFAYSLIGDALNDKFNPMIKERGEN